MLLRFENRRCVFSQCFKTKGPRVNSLNLNFAMSSSSPVKFIVVVSHVAVAMCVPRYCSVRRPWQLTLVRLVFQSPAKKIRSWKLKTKKTFGEKVKVATVHMCTWHTHTLFMLCLHNIHTVHDTFLVQNYNQTTNYLSIYNINTNTCFGKVEDQCYSSPSLLFLSFFIL